MVSGCSVFSRPYEYVDSTEFDGYEWGEDLASFDHLEYLGACRLTALSCGVPLPGEISVYRRTPQTFGYPGATLTSVRYIFCYLGIAARLCGADVEFESQEFELADHHEPPDGKTNYERIRSALVAKHGVPHRGKLPNGRIRVVDANNIFVVPEIYDTQRYSWCGIGDPHAPHGCKTTIVLSYEPLLGHGSVLYASEELRKLIGERQRQDPYADGIYETLYEFAKPRQMPVSLGCDAYSAAQATPLANPLATERASLFSESIRAVTASRRGGSPLEEPSRGIAPTEAHAQYILAKQQLQKHRGDWRLQAYWWGYMVGLGHKYYEGRDDTEEAHEKWLNSVHASHRYVVTFGIGYKDAVAQSTQHVPEPLG